MDKLLMLLSQNARLSDQKLAVMTDSQADEVNSKITEYEKKGIIRGYKAIIDWELADNEFVSAIIEIKVTPKKDCGFEAIARKIASFPEVESVYLMSGGYDIAVHIQGKSFREVAMFVASRLSPMDSVLSTATHFVLKKYKEQGIPFIEIEEDERSMISP